MGQAIQQLSPWERSTHSFSLAGPIGSVFWSDLIQQRVSSVRQVNLHNRRRWIQKPSL